MKKFFTLCQKIAEYSGITFLFIMTMIIFLQVFCRYVLNHALAWPEEMSRVFFIWLAYSGFAVVTKEENHLRIDILIYFTKGKSKEFLLTLCEFINLCFFAIIVYLTWDMTIRVHELDQRAFAFPYPIYITWAIMCFYCVICTVAALESFYSHCKKLVSKG